MMPTRCALCKTIDNDTLLFRENFTKKVFCNDLFSARRLPDRIHYRIVRCNRCRLVRSDPILPYETITALYRQSNTTYEQEILYMQQTYGHYLKRLGVVHPEEKKLLEIGCGNGFFLEEARRQGYKSVWGVEPGKKSAKNAHGTIRKYIKVALFSKTLFPNASFDIICCFHTLDHVIYPNTFVTDVGALLKPGGTALFIVHDVESFSAKILGEHSPIFDIEHIYLFSKKTLPALFEKHGFIVRKVFDILNTYPLRYWLRMSPVPFKNTIAKFLKILELSKIPFTFAGGNIGIIAQKPLLL